MKPAHQNEAMALLRELFPKVTDSKIKERMAEFFVKLNREAMQ